MAEQEYVITAEPYKALADGQSDNAAAIQAALNDAAKCGGTVVIPAAEKPFSSGPLTLASGTTLRIQEGATLQMLPYGTYPGTTDFIRGDKVENVSIEGGGSIEGLGRPWWEAFDSTKIDRPKAMIAFEKAKKLKVSGITLRNPPQTHLQFRNGCSDVVVSDFTIDTPQLAHNTDGINVSVAGFLMERCRIQCGDDNVAVGGKWKGSSDVTIRDCHFGHGHGLSLGTAIAGGVRNMLVENCTFENTDNGIRLKATREGGGLVTDLVFSDITMKDVVVPIDIKSYYPKMPKSFEEETTAEITSTTPFWKNIVLRNITAVSTNVPKKKPSVVYGLPEAPVENISFENVVLNTPKGLLLAHVRGLKLGPGVDVKAGITKHDVEE